MDMGYGVWYVPDWIINYQWSDEMNWLDECIFVNVERKSAIYTQGERRKLTPAKKDAFRRMVANDVGISFHEAKKNICHHILPLGLGGRESNHNKVLCDPYLEYLCHYFIDCQTEGMEIGHKRTILIPRFKGQYWRYEP